MLPVPGATTDHASFGLSISAESRLPVAVGVPGVPLLTPPASVTLPVAVPLIVAASFAPAIVTMTSCAVPSAVRAVNVSVSGALAVLSACTAALLLSRV